MMTWNYPDERQEPITFAAVVDAAQKELNNMPIYAIVMHPELAIVTPTGLSEHLPAQFLYDSFRINGKFEAVTFESNLTVRGLSYRLVDKYSVKMERSSGTKFASTCDTLLMTPIVARKIFDDIRDNPRSYQK